MVGLDGWGSEAAGGQLDWWAGVAPGEVCGMAGQASGAARGSGRGVGRVGRLSWLGRASPRSSRSKRVITTCLKL
jgi:hypothetical protein